MMNPAIPPRFATRQVGATWTVYNWDDLEPARIGGVAQIGLDRDTAATIADRLNLAVARERGRRTEYRSSLAGSRGLTLVSGTEAA